MRTGRLVSVLLSALLCSTPLLASIPTPQELPLESLVRRVQTRYREMTDLRARFRQRQIQRPGMPAIVKQGWWMIRTPGRLRIEYDDSGRLFVADGERMYWYLPDDHQVQILPQDRLDPRRTPTLYLTGKGDLLEDFDVSGIQWEDRLAPGDVQIRLDPKRPGARFTYLILEIDPASATVRRLVWFGLLGEANDFQYFEVQTDVGLAEDLFRFTIPPDARVEYLGN